MYKHVKGVNADAHKTLTLHRLQFGSSDPCTAIFSLNTGYLLSCQRCIGESDREISPLCQAGYFGCHLRKLLKNNVVISIISWLFRTGKYRLQNCVDFSDWLSVMNHESIAKRS
jgi:hypothetical protein